LATTIAQLTTVRTPRRLNKLSRWITKTRRSKYSLFALIQKSELNINDEDVFPRPQACIDNKARNLLLSENKCGVVIRRI